MKKAFTLIELLVVVLIIGILSAIALPQYEKAVEKSRAAEPMTLLNALGKAQEVYYMANGTYADSFNLLDVEIPSSYQPSDKCTVFVTTDCVANQDWAIGWEKDTSWGWRFFYAIRLKGKYAVEETNTNQAILVYIVTRLGSAHHTWQKDHQLICSSNGDYCKSVFGVKSQGGWIQPFSGLWHEAYPL